MSSHIAHPNGGKSTLRRILSRKSNQVDPASFEGQPGGHAVGQIGGIACRLGQRQQADAVFAAADGEALGAEAHLARIGLQQMAVVSARTASTPRPASPFLVYTAPVYLDL